jgi:hypothetical protein
MPSSIPPWRSQIWYSTSPPPTRQYKDKEPEPLLTLRPLLPTKHTTLTLPREIVAASASDIVARFNPGRNETLTESVVNASIDVLYRIRVDPEIRLRLLCLMCTMETRDIHRMWARCERGFDLVIKWLYEGATFRDFAITIPPLIDVSSISKNNLPTKRSDLLLAPCRLTLESQQGKKGEHVGCLDGCGG